MNCTQNQIKIKTRHTTAPTMRTTHGHFSNNDQEECSINSAKFKSFMSEFLATFLFVYLGQSALTSFELNGTQNDIINRQIATIIFYGLAYSLASLVALNVSGAHLNPAYTLAHALFGRISWCRSLNYICAQYLGSFAAAIFLHVTYNDKLGHRHSEGLLTGMNSTLRAHGNILSTGKLFSSYPPTEVSLTQLTISYTLATAHLTFLVLVIHESKLVKISRSLKPIYLASALCVILAAFSGNGGPVLNPAQDFSPRLYIAMFGWGSSAFNLYHYRYWWICGICAPHVGAIIGFGVYRLVSQWNYDELSERIPLENEHDDYTPTKQRDNDFS